MVRFPWTGQEQTGYGKEEARLYAAGEYGNGQRVFEEDVLYCTEVYFKFLLNSVFRNIRNALTKDGAHIGKRLGFGMSTVLPNHIARTRAEDLRVQNEGINAVRTTAINNIEQQIVFDKDDICCQTNRNASNMTNDCRTKGYSLPGDVSNYSQRTADTEGYQQSPSEGSLRYLKIRVIFAVWI